MPAKEVSCCHERTFSCRIMEYAIECLEQGTAPHSEAQYIKQFGCGRLSCHNHKYGHDYACQSWIARICENRAKGISYELL